MQTSNNIAIEYYANDELVEVHYVPEHFHHSLSCYLPVLLRLAGDQFSHKQICGLDVELSDNANTRVYLT